LIRPKQRQLHINGLMCYTQIVCTKFWETQRAWTKSHCYLLTNLFWRFKFFRGLSQSLVFWGLREFQLQVLLPVLQLIHPYLTLRITSDTFLPEGGRGAFVLSKWQDFYHLHNKEGLAEFYFKTRKSKLKPLVDCLFGIE
jgi:hypothetical protein